MDLAYYVGRAWDFLLWFAETIVTTVATSILGGWTAVFGMAGVALMLFLITRLFVRPSGD
jgi:hypothetical protein